MGLADDTGRLRHEIEELRSARIALKKDLSRYAFELHHGMHDERSAMRKSSAQQAAHAKAARSSFVSNSRRAVRDSLAGFRRQRQAARRFWMGSAAPMRPLK